MYMLVLLFLHGISTDSSNGCTTGTFSFNNECRQCPENCGSCDSEIVCNLCKIGYHGETCSLACPQHCHDNECEKTSGTCLSCRKGYYSSENKTCKQCPESCATCRSKSNCFACKSGYRGDFCEIACYKCKEGTSCDKNTGYCLDSCTDGLSGDLCDTNCDTKCKSCLRRNNNECTTCALDRHGINCNENCSSTCKKKECNDKDGVCTNGCLAGFWGPMCENLCSVNCKNSVCLRQNGACLEGCTEGFYDHNCSKAHHKPQSGIFLYIGSPIITVVVVIIIVFVVTCYKKRWYSRISCRKPTTAEDVAKALRQSSNQKYEISRQTYGTETNTDKTETVSMLPVAESKTENDGDNVQEGPSKSYSDICFIPIDRYKQSTTYVVSYGPTKALKDIAFWKKIWEIECEIIVMITTVHDSQEINVNRILVVEQDNLTVIFEQGHSCVYYTQRPVSLQMNQEAYMDERNVTLFEFFAWPPDVDIPDNIESFLEFHNKVKRSKTTLSGPTLVHCSVGLHRCGTYVAFNMLQKNARSLNRDDIVLCLDHLKSHGIKTTEQIDDFFQMFATPRTSHN